MKNKLTLLGIGFLILLSCDREEPNFNDFEELQNKVELTQTLHYKGQSYQIDYYENSEGELEPITALPDALQNLDNIKELSTFIDGNNIYYFDNLQGNLEFLGVDFEVYLASKSKDNSLTSAYTFNASAFNDGVRAYEHDNFSGRRLSVNSVEDLKDLRRVGFNDVMSSVAIWNHYPVFASAPQNGEIIVFYSDINWRGKTLTFTSTQLFNYSGGGYYNGLPRLYRGSNKFRNLSYSWTRKWADKVSSIDVLIANSSILR